MPWGQVPVPWPSLCLVYYHNVACRVDRCEGQQAVCTHSDTGPGHMVGVSSLLSPARMPEWAASGTCSGTLHCIHGMVAQQLSHSAGDGIPGSVTTL